MRSLLVRLFLLLIMFLLVAATLSLVFFCGDDCWWCRCDHVVVVVDNLFADVVVHQENDDLTMSAITGGTLVDGDSVIGR